MNEQDQRKSSADTEAALTALFAECRESLIAAFDILSDSLRDALGDDGLDLMRELIERWESLQSALAMCGAGRDASDYSDSIIRKSRILERVRFYMVRLGGLTVSVFHLMRAHKANPRAPPLFGGNNQ